MPDEKDLLIDELRKENQQLISLVSELQNTITELQETIKDLREQLNKNSGNSSKPPSSDGFKKSVNKNRSLRKKSGKKPGGQNGHNGSYLTVLSEPDHTENHLHSDCAGCPHYEKCRAAARLKEIRYVIDAVVDVDITAHKLLSVPRCIKCGCEKTGSFPDSVSSNIQYGENLESLVVTLNTVGAVSVNRTHEILGGVFNIPISTGTINNMVSRCANKVEPVYSEIGERLKASPIDHADETGTSINGKLEWAHCLSNDKYTYIELHQKRGFKAIEDIGLLTGYKGILVHDCWSPYWKLEGVIHQLCCAHLLRELNGVSENHPEQKWAPQFKALLLKMKRSKERAIGQGKDAFRESTLKKYSERYDEIIKLAYEENPVPEKMPGKRGKQKRGKVLSLIDRLKGHKAEVCLFVNNFAVPFDNNQAERDIRNIKIKTKVSGFFKTEDGAKNYLRIMSFVSTARKLGKTAYEAIRSAVIGEPAVLLGLGTE